MSVDSKAFVTCGKDKMFDVIGSVTSALNDYSRTKLDVYIKQHPDLENRFMYKNKDHDKKFSNGVYFTGHTPECINFVFGSGDNMLRTLSMIPDCSLDYSNIHTGDKIIFSIGAWGENKEIMQVVINAIKWFGDVYYDFNDCDDKDFVKVA